MVAPRFKPTRTEEVDTFGMPFNNSAVFRSEKIKGRDRRGIKEEEDDRIRP
jgi:hypothetical protein